MSTLFTLTVNFFLVLAAAAILILGGIALLRATSRRAVLLPADRVQDMPQSAVSDWLALAFSVLAVLALAVSFFSVDIGVPLMRQNRVVASFLCGSILAVMAVFFLFLANSSRALLLVSLERADSQRGVDRALNLARDLPKEDELRRRLYVALALHLSGARKANGAVPQVVMGTSWRPVCATRPLFRARLEKRHRSKRC